MGLHRGRQPEVEQGLRAADGQVNPEGTTLQIRACLRGPSSGTLYGCGGRAYAAA